MTGIEILLKSFGIDTTAIKRAVDDFTGGRTPDEIGRELELALQRVLSAEKAVRETRVLVGSLYARLADDAMSADTQEAYIASGLLAQPEQENSENG